MQYDELFMKVQRAQVRAELFVFICRIALVRGEFSAVISHIARMQSDFSLVDFHIFFGAGLGGLGKRLYLCKNFRR